MAMVAVLSSATKESPVIVTVSPPDIAAFEGENAVIVGLWPCARATRLRMTAALTRDEVASLIRIATDEGKPTGTPRPMQRSFAQ